MTTTRLTQHSPPMLCCCCSCCQPTPSVHRHRQRVTQSVEVGVRSESVDCPQPHLWCPCVCVCVCWCERRSASRAHTFSLGPSRIAAEIRQPNRSSSSSLRQSLPVCRAACCFCCRVCPSRPSASALVCGASVCCLLNVGNRVLVRAASLAQLITLPRLVAV